MSHMSSLRLCSLGFSQHWRAQKPVPAAEHAAVVYHRPAARPWARRCAAVTAAPARPPCHLAAAKASQTQAPTQPLAVEEAWALLEDLTQKEARGLAQALVGSPEARSRLRDALLVAAASPHAPAGWDPAREPREVLLGLLSSDVRLAVRALRDYCQALGLPFAVPESRVPGCATLPAITGPVYVKYNSASGLCYASRYEGRDRGVLVQLGQRQVGHLPLGLFDEERRNPPPQL